MMIDTVGSLTDKNLLDLVVVRFDQSRVIVALKHGWKLAKEERGKTVKAVCKMQCTIRRNVVKLAVSVFECKLEIKTGSVCVCVCLPVTSNTMIIN